MMEFTKEQLIAHITAKATRIKPDSQVNDSLRIEAQMNERALEIALASHLPHRTIFRHTYWTR